MIKRYKPRNPVTHSLLADNSLVLALAVNGHGEELRGGISEHRSPSGHYGSREVE